MQGYGHSTPNTNAGKAFCMIYAMVGIPLGLVMFQSIGERLNKFASIVIRRFKIFMKCSHTEATEINLMAATGFLSSIIILTGAAVFSNYEGWSYFDSFYYCFGEFRYVYFLAKHFYALNLAYRSHIDNNWIWRLRSSPERQSLRESWLHNLGTRFHPLWSRRRCCFHQFVGAQIHDDVSSSFSPSTDFMKFFIQLTSQISGMLKICALKTRSKLGKI